MIGFEFESNRVIRYVDFYMVMVGEVVIGLEPLVLPLLDRLKGDVDRRQVGNDSLYRMMLGMDHLRGL